MSDDNVTIWDCTQCGGKLVRRKNRATGETFLGCSNYPKCKFTQPDEPPEDDLNGVKDAASVWE
jgi:ssDNA-binding Zn-finger/Zn-ribbon topoisomerase 1